MQPRLAMRVSRNSDNRGMELVKFVFYDKQLRLFYCVYICFVSIRVSVLQESYFFVNIEI